MRLICLVATFLLSLSTVCVAQYGSFVGTLTLEDVPPSDREFRVTSTFSYRDESGKIWVVPAGTVVNGASIPQFFWSFIGGPWEGLYRRASVVHDHYCSAKSEPWDKVHQMFYDGMRAGGVNEPKAKVMYYAVWRFGPRWETHTRSTPVCNNKSGDVCTDWRQQLESQTITIIPDFIESQARAFVEQIETRDITLAEIRTMADTQLKEAIYNNDGLQPANPK